MLRRTSKIKQKQIVETYEKYGDILPDEFKTTIITDLATCVDIFSEYNYLVQQHNDMITYLSLLQMKEESESLLKQQKDDNNFKVTPANIVPFSAKNKR